MHVARHRGVSIVDQDPATPHDTFHVWFDGPFAALRHRWDAALVARGLAGPLTPTGAHPARGSHAWAAATPLLPLDRVGDALARPSVGTALGAALDLHGRDAATDAGSTAIHHALARAHGWPSQRGVIGVEPVTHLGMGRHAAVLVRNLFEGVGAPLVIAGRDKVAARSLLHAAGLRVPDGRVVSTAADGVAWARDRGAVVVKAAAGGNGDAVYLGLGSAPSVRSALGRVLTGRPHAIVEEQVSGTELRVHVAAGEIVACFAPVPTVVLGDGCRTVADLGASAHPRLWATIEATGWLRRRTVQHCWHLGARRFADLDRLVPGWGDRVTIAPGTGAGMATADIGAVHEEDRSRIEALFRRFGPASGALDLVLRTPGSRLADGGAVLDLNVPCGSAYLADRLPEIANTELGRWLAPSFRSAGGRVPLVLLPGGQGTGAAAAEAEATRSWFAGAYPGGRAHGALDDRGWTPVLDDRTATALLVPIDEPTVLDHGVPSHARPVLVDPTGALPELVRDAVVRAGGVVHRARLANGDVSFSPAG